jgi:hypothetical protein
MGSIRKRRFAAFTALGLVGATVIGGGMASGELPMNLSISGQSSFATISSGTAQNVTVYSREVETTTKGSLPSVALSLESAQLTDVCLSTVAHGLPFIGDVTMYVRVPGKNTTVENLVVDASSLGGSIKTGPAQLGLDVSATGQAEGVVTAGKTVSDATMTQARIDVIALNASALSMKNFTIDVDKGDSSC